MKQKHEQRELGYEPSKNLHTITLDGQEYISSQEVARRLGICQSSFYATKNRLGFRGVRCGRRVFYSEKYLAGLLFGSLSGKKEMAK